MLNDFISACGLFMQLIDLFLSKLSAVTNILEELKVYYLNWSKLKMQKYVCFAKVRRCGTIL